MYSDEAVEMYQELRREGLYPKEAAGLTDELMCGTYSDPGPTEPWQVVLGLAMVFVCAFTIFLGG